MPCRRGAVRENNGKWIIGYNRRLGACSIIETELWDILDGVLLVQERHYHKILVQTDNIKVIEAINDSLSKCSNSAIIRRIAQLLQKVESWSLDYIPGEENIEADCIAKFAFGRGKGLHLFETSFDITYESRDNKVTVPKLSSVDPIPSSSIEKSFFA
ncbi:hypothetical protein Goari_015116 [Gossypium aridum]|uniref:RNase H type-1 domain-containing protein n=1 Tax=Gossypium aridum TaxID=34290 RepID=A0A7J8XKX9_GOSAI|nr:hypothetical protein [Gossypium aridum]